MTANQPWCLLIQNVLQCVVEVLQEFNPPGLSTSDLSGIMEVL